MSSVPRSALGLDDDQVVLVTVGRLVQRKANHQLIEILSKIADRRVILVIIGDGPERRRLEEKAGRLRVASRVKFTGFVKEEQKYQYLKAADVFVSTTMHEGFGLMFIEAMFCGLPIVTYDHGGQRDLVEDEKSGRLVSLNNRDQFRAAVEGLVRDEALRRELGKHAAKVSERFTIRDCAARYESVFSEVLPRAREVAPRK